MLKYHDCSSKISSAFELTKLWCHGRLSKISSGVTLTNIETPCLLIKTNQWCPPHESWNTVVSHPQETTVHKGCTNVQCCDAYKCWNSVSNNPMNSLIWTSGECDDAYCINVNIVHSLWHVDISAYQWSAGTLTANISSWRLGCLTSLPCK